MMLLFPIHVSKVMHMNEIESHNKDESFRCDRCDTPMQTETWNKAKDSINKDADTDASSSYQQIENGINLTFNGGYGMFIDPIHEDAVTLNICHDCTVMMLSLFPDRTRRRFIGGHPAYEEAPISERCCEYSWCLSDTPSFLSQ